MLNSTTTIRTPQPGRRNGFTLVEVLLSMTLVIVLIVAVYAGLDVYRRISTVGRAEVDRSQLARAIQQKIAVDIRSVIFTPPKQETAEETEGEAADESLTEETESLPEELDPATASSAGSKGVVGNSTMLVLNISRPPRGLNYSSFLDAGDARSRTSDLISVTYLLAGSNGPNVAQLIASNSGKTGLARMAGDRLSLDQADEEGNDQLLAESGTVIAEEVNLLEFRYFDGTDWLDAWDSRTSGTLPRAIEVTIGFESAVADPDGGTKAAYVKRFVVTLPAADPTPPTTLGL